MTSPYRRGADFERRLEKKLLDLGYQHTGRSAGSGGLVDVYAWKGRQAYFIQAKSGKFKKMTRAEKLALVDLAHDCGAIPVLVTRGMKFEVLSGDPMLSDRAA